MVCHRESRFHIFAIILCLFVSRSFAADIAYISEEKRTSLRQEFKAAHAISHLDGKWICEMYGVHSGMQVKTGVRLYDFGPSATGFRNRGAQMVEVYSVRESRMQGATDRVSDELKLSDDGRLLSQLTLIGSGDVLAYSVCQR